MSNVVEIKLRDGSVTKVDKDIAERIQREGLSLSRNNGGYVQVGGLPNKGRPKWTGLHQLSHGRAPKGMMLDHIDGDRLNNTRKNIRVVNRSQNNRLKIVHKAKTDFDQIVGKLLAIDPWLAINVDLVSGALVERLEKAIVAANENAPKPKSKAGGTKAVARGIYETEAKTYQVLINHDGGVKNYGTYPTFAQAQAVWENTYSQIERRPRLKRTAKPKAKAPKKAA